VELKIFTDAEDQNVVCRWRYRSQVRSAKQSLDGLYCLMMLCRPRRVVANLPGGAKTTCLVSEENINLLFPQQVATRSVKGCKTVPSAMILGSPNSELDKTSQSEFVVRSNVKDISFPFSEPARLCFWPDWNLLSHFPLLQIAQT